MNKELTPLEVLTRLKNIDWFCPKNNKDTLSTIYKNDFNVIEKALKTIEIIKEKEIFIQTFINTTCVEDYNNNFFDENSGYVEKYLLTEEEYNLLKKVLL